MKTPVRSAHLASSFVLVLALSLALLFPGASTLRAEPPFEVVLSPATTMELHMLDGQIVEVHNVSGYRISQYCIELVRHTNKLGQGAQELVIMVVPLPAVQFMINKNERANVVPQR